MKLLELSDNAYKIKGNHTIESTLPEISETETLAINETQMKLQEAVDNKVIEEQVVNNIERPIISNNDAEPQPQDIAQPADWKK